ncbi:MAG: hypothetical protein A4E32_00539 [Methanomassiliicoccales archaeon PtaU1.Bin124]|nr:MAG: hypothetical protein A4E32_00539 [Methanomassiliicoccales archaeon PtaU1.Bin124]
MGTFEFKYNGLECFSVQRAEISEELDVCYDAEGFREEVGRELAEEDALLFKVRQPRKWSMQGHALALVLLALSASAIYLDEHILYAWMIIGLLLYSYNFLILLIPTTTDRSRPKETMMLRKDGRSEKWLAIRLLLKKKLLAMEIGISVFLGGMVPLVLSFTVIFGLGLVFALYFAAIAHIMSWSVAVSVVVQVGLILGFYGLVYFLEPESQGVTKFARTLKEHYSAAKVQGRKALAASMLIITVVVVGGLILFIGAILLPGSTLAAIWDELSHIGGTSLLALVMIFAAQLYIMRHFQSVASRSMASRLLSARTEKMRNEVLARMDSLLANREAMSYEHFERQFEEVRRTYYSMAIYDMVEVDIFGRSPVYLVGPRLKYVLNDKVLNHFRA